MFGSALPSPPPHPVLDGGIRPAVSSLPAFSVHVAPVNLEQVLKRYMPVQNTQSPVIEPDMYPKHGPNIFVYGKTDASNHLLYLRRTVQEKVRVRALPNMSSVMAWVQSSFDHATYARFLELYWDGIEAAAESYDPAAPSPQAYVLFLQSFVAHFVPRLDEGDLYARYARHLVGTELVSLSALHDWTLELRNASASVVGTDYWAARKELDALQSCARIPIDILVAVNATHPVDFAAFLCALEMVTRGRMKMMATRQRGSNARPAGGSVRYVDDESPEVGQRLEALQRQVQALELGRGGAGVGGKGKAGGGKGDAKGGAANTEARGEGKIRCFVCDQLGHFAKKCPLVARAKELSSSSSSPPSNLYMLVLGCRPPPPRAGRGEERVRL